MYHRCYSNTHSRCLHARSGSLQVPKLENLPLPLNFMKHFPAIPREFKLKTNTGCAWRVTMRLMNGRVSISRGWDTFVVGHHIMIGYMLTFKLLTSDTMKVIVFDDEGVEVVTKCKEHGNASSATA
ncbi:Speckle-type POZ protein [Hordeum vulgare]|nr:Speckle-type POZ protein [Hordeum vulgare]